MNNNKERFAFKKVVLAVALCFLANGCAVDPKTGQPSFKQTFDNDDPCSNNARNTGIALGALAGSVIGHQLDRRSGKYAGAITGALIGGLIGADMDMRRCELSKVAKQYNLDITFATVDSQGATLDDAALKGSRQADEIKKNAIGSVVAVRNNATDGGHFESGSDRLTPRAQEYFAAIAQSYNARRAAERITDPQEKENYARHIANRKLLLVGHTDDTGSSRLNADLSERRARAVAKFLNQQGIALDSLYFQGAGESYPIAENGTEAGRLQNRRVEFVEIADEANLRKYLEARKPRYEYYRPAERTTAQEVVLAPPSARSSDRKAAAKADTARAPASATATNGAATAATKTAPEKAREPKAASARETPQAATGKSAGSAAPPSTSTSTSALPAQSSASAANDSNRQPQIDFGGTRVTRDIAALDVGKVEQKKSWFSIISPAYANEPAILSDCTQDRPRISGSVKALRDGKQFDTSEHLPGLYGKTWTDKVNGHQIVVNKIAVLRNDAAIAQLPEFKVYANYKPEISRNPAPDLVVTPEVNTYLGSNGVLYRMFIKGKAGLQCADVLFSGEGGAAAKAGKLMYTHDRQTYVADFKPSRIQ